MTWFGSICSMSHEGSKPFKPTPRLLFRVRAVTIRWIEMRARYHAWVLLLALSCTGALPMLSLVPFNSSSACCASSACCKGNCLAASHNVPAGESCRGAINPRHSRQALCTCSVSPNPSYLMVTTHSDSYLEPPRAVLVPALDPLRALDASILLPLRDGHVRPPDQPPRLH